MPETLGVGEHIFQKGTLKSAFRMDYIPFIASLTRFCRWKLDFMQNICHYESGLPLVRKFPYCKEILPLGRKKKGNENCMEILFTKFYIAKILFLEYFNFGSGF